MGGATIPFPYTFISYKRTTLRYCLTYDNYCHFRYSQCSLPNLLRNPKVFRGVTHSTVFPADNSSLQPHTLLLRYPSCCLSIYSRVSEVVLSLHLFRMKDCIHLSPLQSALHSSHVIVHHLTTLIIFAEW